MDFDVIIASDCLYFSSQEAPLAAVLRKRLVRPGQGTPGGTAMVVVQTRSNGGLQVVRFKELLSQSGFQVRSGTIPNNDQLLNRVWTVPVDGNALRGDAVQLHSTGREVDEHVLFVTWRG